MVVFIFIHSCGEFLEKGVDSYDTSQELASASLTCIYYAAQMLNPTFYCLNPDKSFRLICRLQRPIKSSIKPDVLQTAHAPLLAISCSLAENQSVTFNNTVAPQESDSGKGRLMVSMVKDVKDHKHLFACVRMGSLEFVSNSVM